MGLGYLQKYHAKLKAEKKEREYQARLNRAKRTFQFMGLGKSSETKAEIVEDIEFMVGHYNGNLSHLVENEKIARQTLYNWARRYGADIDAARAKVPRKFNRTRQHAVTF